MNLTGTRRWVWWIIFGIPAVVCALWLGSGREVLTKQRKPMEVVVEDSVFGDSSTETRWASGPIFGYYVGLDLVAVAVAASLAAAGALFWQARRSDRRVRGRQNEPQI